MKKHNQIEQKEKSVQETELQFNIQRDMDKETRFLHLKYQRIEMLMEQSQHFNKLSRTLMVAYLMRLKQTHIGHTEKLLQRHSKKLIT
jgi:hypothetical protein